MGKYLRFGPSVTVLPLLSHILVSITVLVVIFGQTANAADTGFCYEFVSSKSNQYVCREYTVQTEDGFILTLHRLSASATISNTSSLAPEALSLAPTTSAKRPAGNSDFNLENGESDQTFGETANPMQRGNEAHMGGDQPYGSSFRLDKYPDQPFSKRDSKLDQQDFKRPVGFSTASMPVRDDEFPPPTSAEASNTVVKYEPAPGTPSMGPMSSPLSRNTVPFTAPSRSGNYANHDQLSLSMPDETASARRTSGSSQNIVTFTPSSTPTSPYPGHNAPASDVHLLRPVLLLHHEFLSGASWFTYTGDHGVSGDELFPFLLADAGYDIWVGHHRATYWGHDHAFLTEDDQEYWSWSWDEHAEFDIPAILGFIHKQTRSSVHVIGISQSATAAAAAATVPRVAHIMKSLTLIGPTVYTGDANSDVLEAWAYVLGESLDQVFYDKGYQHGAFNFSMVGFRAFPPHVSKLDGRSMALALSTISGPNCCLGPAVLNFSNGWDGTTSFKNLIHIQQGLRTNKWRKFDFGDAEDNVSTYGNKSPPAYNCTDIPSTLRILVVYGGKDNTAPPKGVRRFMSQLSVSPATIYLRLYAHADLGFSTSRAKDVFMPTIGFLDYVENQTNSSLNSLD